MDFTSELNGVLDDNSLWRIEPMPTVAGSPDRVTPPSQRQGSVSAQTPILSLSPMPRSVDCPAESYNDLDRHSSDEEDFMQHLRSKSRIEVAQAGRPRFLGKSSRAKFLQQVLQYREQYSGDSNWRSQTRPDSWYPQLVCLVVLSDQESIAEQSH